MGQKSLTLVDGFTGVPKVVCARTFERMLDERTIDSEGSHGKNEACDWGGYGRFNGTALRPDKRFVEHLEKGWSVV